MFNVFHRRKHYLCISAPAMPLPDTPAQPGPANYDVVDYEGPPKHYMSSSAFVSTTSRWTGNVSVGELPGPGGFCHSAQVKMNLSYNLDIPKCETDFDDQLFRIPTLQFTVVCVFF